ncbi:MAG: FAD-dependent oxidoreductase [Candidatus Coatesbacteria bacterium]|nr:FAD-dependent oxidoreductase [Candidatus Coatesbacteria bacterium]
MKVLIVGNGIAGNAVAFGLRELGANCEIAIISAEEWPEYDPCSLPYFVGGDVPREAVFRRTQNHYDQNRIDLILGDEAVAIDPSAKCVTTGSGAVNRYDKLVLAHGGRLVRPRIPNLDMKGVFSCKELSEADRLFEHEGSTAVVIGSGAIGVEVAEALKKRGLEVTIIELLGWILPAMFDEPISRRLEDSLKGNGISVLTGEKVLRIEGDGSVAQVVTDKRTIDCDTVVVATGVVPRKELAESADIRVNRGIVVDESMATSVEGIYACGDCAEVVDALTGVHCVSQLKHNALEQAKTVVKGILGKRERYPGAYAFARAHFFDTHAAMFGRTTQSLCDSDDVEVIDRSSGDDCLRIILKGGKVVGGQAIGEYADSIGLFMGAMWRGDDLGQIRGNWQHISKLDSPAPWIYRKLGRLIGLAAEGS